MRTTVPLRNIIGKAQYLFVISISPLQRYFDADTFILLTSEMKDLIDAIFTRIDIADKF